MIKVVIGGGDGSIMSLIDELYLYQVDISRCIFGILPIGRNNDLSRALGWGGSLTLTSDFVEFKEIVKLIADAPSVNVDVFELKLICDDKEGEIIEIKNNEKVKKEENGKVLTTFSKPFISYFSLGNDARIGFGFDKSRSTNKFANCCSYFWETSKKLCCRNTLKVKGFLDSFYSINLENENNFNVKDNNQDITIRENEASKKIIFNNIENNKITEQYDNFRTSSPVNNINSDDFTTRKNTVCKLYFI